MDAFIGCHNNGSYVSMNFMLPQDSKGDFTKYLLHKGVISFNRTKYHCLSSLSFSQNELKKGGHRALLCSWDSRHLFNPRFLLAIPSPSLGKLYLVLRFIKSVCDSLTSLFPETSPNLGFFTSKDWPVLLLSFPFPKARMLQGPAS